MDNWTDSDELFLVYRRLPVNNREGDIMRDALNSDGNGYILEIENSIKDLKKCKSNDDKSKQYSLIADGIRFYLHKTNTETFTRKLILSFFQNGFFPTTTQNRHVKKILEFMNVTDENLPKVTRQRRIYELKSNDFNSYSALMRANGHNKIFYYKFVVDKNGIPRRKKTATSNINGQPRDKNGELTDDFDEATINATLNRRNEGVFSYGNKSIAIEQRRYNVKGYALK